MKEIIVFILCVVGFLSIGGTIKFDVKVLDEETGEPIENVEVCGSFTVGNDHIKSRYYTDKNGVCHIRGYSNKNRAGCYVKNPPEGYYKPCYGWKHIYKEINALGCCLPDNLTATIKLQRVEHAIPLLVKQVDVTYENGLGTNSIMRFDFLKGDWLPPYGKGDVADIEIHSRVEITGKEQFCFGASGYDWLYFYNLINTVKFPGEGNGIAKHVVNRFSGIGIRKVGDEMFNEQISEVIGVKKENVEHDVVGKNWNPVEFNTYNPDLCYTFRIRSRFNNGELVAANYGKIYNGFKFWGDDKRGTVNMRFRYYLNPVCNDMNLEWNTKTNLFPKQSLNYPVFP